MHQIPNPASTPNANPRSTHRRASRIAIALSVVVLLGCGGDEEDPTTVTLNTFSLSVATLAPSSSGSVPVRASFNATSQTTTTSNTRVTLSLHVIPATASADSISATNRVALFDCPLLSPLCANVDCIFSADRLFGCGALPGLTLQAGNYNAVGRACVKNNANVEICAQKSFALTVT